MEWIAFDKLEPFAWDVQFVGNAITAATVANVNRGKGKKAAKPGDFMPKLSKPQTLEQQIQFAQMMTLALGGTVGEGGE